MFWNFFYLGAFAWTSFLVEPKVAARARREQNRFGVIGDWQMCARKTSDSGKTDMITEQTIDAERIAAPPPGQPTPDASGLEPELQDHIGIQLRAVYNEVLNEPVPDRFLQLLADLERKQAERP